MKKIILFFVGILMLATMLALLFFSGAIYDTEKKHTIETFFFEPNLKSEQRVSQPVAADDIPDDFLREAMIKRFVNEYFYVVPDANNAQKRMTFKNTDNTTTALRILSVRPEVYQGWLDSTAPEILELSEKGVLRLVQVQDISESESGHLIVRYELKTWTQPNNVLAEPVITNGDLYIDVTKRPIRVKQNKQTLDELRRGVDPVSAFTFGISEVIKD